MQWPFMVGYLRCPAQYATLLRPTVLSLNWGKMPCYYPNKYIITLFREMRAGHTPKILTLVHNIRDCPSGAVAHSSFPLVQGEGWDGVLLYALIVKTE